MDLFRVISLLIFLSAYCFGQPSTDKHQKLIEAARSKIGVTRIYDSSYQAIKYPMGDVAADRGVCTDVVIRAFRNGLNMDLQKLVHLDMRSNFSKYPNHWGLKRTDRNIDHRRVPNLKTYFTRRGWKVPVSKNKNDYKPGDLVISKVAGRLPHIMIVSDKKSSTGVPYVIHNIGRGTQEEDTLFEYPIYGHFRIK